MKEIQEINYENRLIAFIDILGFSEIVKQSENDSKKIELIYSILDYLKNWETSESWDLKLVEIEEDAQRKGVKYFDIREKTNCTSFSDSIVISVKVDNNVNEMTSTLIANIAYIGAILLEEGVLLRGGLTIGNIVHNENGTVFGQGLIDAYELERNCAKFPRIVFSDKIIKHLNYPLNSKYERYPYHQYIERFEDGCVGFHQMIYYQVVENWTEMTEENIIESLSKIRKVIVGGLDGSIEKPDVFEKYKWLKAQYNKLIILSDFDFDTKTDEHIKIKIQELEDGNAGHNIHYTFADEIRERMKKKDKK